MSKRILIVEDDPKSLYALQSVLQDYGLHVTAVPSAEAYLDSVVHHFDVALLDVRLPGQSGTELAARLRMHQPAIRLIFMTAYNGVREIEAKFPGTHVLVKPLNLDQILRHIRE